MTRRLRLFPLNTVLFPGAVLNLHVFEPRYKKMINDCLDEGVGFGVTLIAEGKEAGDPDVQPHDVGSVAEIVDIQTLPFGRYYISTIGRERFRIIQIVSREPYLTVEAEVIEEDFNGDGEVDALLERVRELFNSYLNMIVEYSGQASTVELPGDAEGASFLVGDALQVADSVKQRLLELLDTKIRLRAEIDFLERLLPQLRKLLERRREELSKRQDDGEDNEYRAEQSRYFGKFFSQN